MIDPRFDSISGLLCEFEADRLLRLVLHDQGAGDGVATTHHIADAQAD
jgi:hypothetical protein